jgi:hypothetical protein
MKNLIGLFFAFVFVSCSSGPAIYSSARDGISDGDFESFAILDMNKDYEDNSQEAVILSNPYMTSIMVFTIANYPDATTHKEIEDAIQQEMISQDYDMTQANPDLFVAYSVYGKSGEITGDFGYDDNVGFDGVKDIDIKEGTLLISVINAEVE